jgi:phosphoglycolate phosphatase-like HAD superfamily hydrolase
VRDSSWSAGTKYNPEGRGDGQVKINYNKAMIKHLIWDLDGTLFDTYPALTDAFLAALADWGHTPEPEVVLGLLQVSMTHCITSLAEAYQLPQEALESGFQSHHARIPYHQQILMPGAQAACAYIRSLGGKNVIVTHRPRHSTMELLDVHGLNPLIDDCIAGDDEFPKKPDPASMLAIMSRNGIDPSEGLAVGDRELDIGAGQAAGLRTCLLGRLDTVVKPDFQVDHLDEVLEIIQRENRSGRED